MTRRKFLRYACGAGLGGLVGAGACAAYAHDIEPFWPALERLDMDLPHLDRALVGVRLLHLSDLHLFRDTGTEYLRAQLARCAALAPDVIVLTGDFITRADSHFLDPLISLLSSLQAPLGVFAVLGNHDWAVFGSRGTTRPPVLADRLERALTVAGVRVLRNTAEVLTRGGAALQLVGLDDLWSGHCEPEQAFEHVDPGLPTIVLAHNPDTIDLLQGRPGDWILCGHTHGGQVRLPLLGAVWLPTENRQYDAGLFDVAGKRLYVNRGLGFVRQLRFNCRPEIALFTLTRRP